MSELVWLSCLCFFPLSCYVVSEASGGHSIGTCIHIDYNNGATHSQKLARGLQGTEKAYNWLCIRSQVALIMLLRATDVLAQHSAGKDSSSNTAIFYADAGLQLLLECDGMFLLVDLLHA